MVDQAADYMVSAVADYMAVAVDDADAVASVLVSFVLFKKEINVFLFQMM